ncbi:unnamed protein product [Protopolystoma xenopodis]|uniref:Uncharacterized protein n=1 Tax=Protopolystoma xenopodis TaxID=117903 RepID=A0A3S5CDB4_9PLAT|nr:unnamed protein product [Protopolystoma xenopodis]
MALKANLLQQSSANSGSGNTRKKSDILAVNVLSFEDPGHMMFTSRKQHQQTEAFVLSLSQHEFVRCSTLPDRHHSGSAFLTLYLHILILFSSKVGWIFKEKQDRS